MRCAHPFLFFRAFRCYIIYHRSGIKRFSKIFFQIFYRFLARRAISILYAALIIVDSNQVWLFSRKVVGSLILDKKATEQHSKDKGGNALRAEIYPKSFENLSKICDAEASWKVSCLWMFYNLTLKDFLQIFCRFDFVFLLRTSVIQASLRTLGLASVLARRAIPILLYDALIKVVSKYGWIIKN